MSRTEEQKIEFIENLYPAAKRVSDRTGLAWETILAQAAQETGWGENVLKGTNNIFNIKADSSWKGPSVTVNAFEFDANGNKFFQDSKFRVYGSIDEALEDRVKFLKENPRYAEAGLFNEGVKGNLRGEANALQRAGYATDPQYAQSLVQVFNSSIMHEGIERAGGPKPNPLSDNMLTRDERGDAVKELQQKLTAAGFSTKGADGYFGQNTEDAVKAYQQSKNLTADGVAGPKTLESLGISLNATQPQPARSDTNGTPTPTATQSAPTSNTPAPAAVNPANDPNWPAPGNYKVKESHGGSDGLGEFGDPRSNSRGYHTGVDISGKVGDPIEAFRPGKVVEVVHNDPGAGNFVTIDHGGGLRTRYLHLDTINVQEGQQVTENTKIGTMGRTGNTPSNADTHLHFETRVNGEPVDPRQYLNFAPRETLDKGDRGKDVQDLQNALIRNGAKITADGTFGDGTKAAVEAFQSTHGLKVDGVAGPATQKALGVTHEQTQTTQPSTPAPGQTTEPKPTQSQNTGAMSDGMLKQGEKGEDVRKLQEALNKNGATLETDGKFGPATKSAVENYQRSHNLDADGVAGPKTLAALGTQQQAQTPAPADKPQTPANSQTTPTPTDKPQTPANAQPTPTDTPQAPANAQPNDKPQMPPSSNTTVPPPTQTDKPLMSNPNHPDNKLYQQAVSNLEQLGPSGGFKSREDLEKAAAAVAADAKATGLKEIDHVSKTNAPNGQSYLVAVQGDPTSPAAKNSYIDYNQATSQTVAQSTQMAEAQKQATPAVPTPDQQRSQDNADPKPKTMMA